MRGLRRPLCLCPKGDLLRWHHTLKVKYYLLFNFLIFLIVCLNISTVINIKILTNSNQQTRSYEFISHISAFLYVVLITEMLEICIQTSYDLHQNVQLILKSYLRVVYGTPLIQVVSKAGLTVPIKYY